MPFLKSIAVRLLNVEARATIAKYQPSIIAITGSVGKTSTKDGVYAGLEEHRFIRKSQKSFNSEIGLPLTILGLPNAWKSPLRWIENIFDGFLPLLFKTRYPDWLVLEVGADRPGDIQRVAKWLPVDIAVITRLPEVPVHVEFFDSPEEVIEEKASLIKALKPSGVLIFFDDPRVVALRERAPEIRTLTYGFAPSSDVCAENVEIVYAQETHAPLGMQCTIVSGDERADVVLEGALGAHSLLPLLCAAAVGRAQNMPLSAIVSSFKTHYTPPSGRMRLLSGLKGSLLIDDSYNASPAAVLAGLESLKQLSIAGRKIAVLGDMLELGKFSVEEHKKIGEVAAQCADLLVTVGVRSRDTAEAALSRGLSDAQVLQYEDADKAGEELAALVKEGDAVYLKGSQSIRLEKAAGYLLADPLRAPELLVRQEGEWYKRP